MTKKQWMAMARTKDFINAVLRMGYSETKGNGSSHRIFKCAGHSPLSIPSDSVLSDGTRRNLVKQIMGDAYYA